MESCGPMSERCSGGAYLPSHSPISGGRHPSSHADLETGVCSSLGAWVDGWRKRGVRAHFGGLLCFVSAASLHQLPIFKMEGI